LAEYPLTALAEGGSYLSNCPPKERKASAREEPTRGKSPVVCSRSRFPHRATGKRKTALDGLSLGASTTTTAYEGGGGRAGKKNISCYGLPSKEIEKGESPGIGELLLKLLRGASSIIHEKRFC